MCEEARINTEIKEMAKEHYDRFKSKYFVINPVFPYFISEI